MSDSSIPADAAEPTWPGLQKCRFCRGPLDRRQSETGLCDDEHCAARQRNEALRLTYRRRWDDHVAVQHARARAHGAEIAAGARALGRPAAEVAVGIVPRLDRPLAPLPAWQRARFLAHLRDIAARAFARPSPGPLPVQRARNEAPDPARSTAACIACRGHCCVLGLASHAFLRVETIDHVRRRHPGLGPDDIVARYAARIPPRGVVDSCVFQGPEGCTLDRTWRADMCNNFQCNGKRQALERAGDADAMLWLASDGDACRAMVHDRDGTRTVAPDPDAGDSDPEHMARASAAVRARLPSPLPETAPDYGTACRRCGSPIDAARAAGSGLCGSAACELAGIRRDGEAPK